MNKYIHERYENKLGYGQVSQTERTERDYEKSSQAFESTQDVLRKRTYAQSFHENVVAEPKISLMEMFTVIEKSVDVLGEHMERLNHSFFPVMRSGIGIEAGQERVNVPHHAEAVLYAITINEKIGALQDRVLQMLDRNEL